MSQMVNSQQHKKHELSECTILFLINSVRLEVHLRELLGKSKSASKLSELIPGKFWAEKSPLIKYFKGQQRQNTSSDETFNDDIFIRLSRLQVEDPVDKVAPHFFFFHAIRFQHG